MDLIQALEQYQPFNEQEEKDKAEMIRRLRGEELYTRGNSGAHLSASAWVVSPDLQNVLLCYHNIYQSWSWLGGHCDGDHDLLHVAVKEVQEESGLREVYPYSEDIFSIEILTVDGHEKRGKYISSHLHLNVTYLLVADMNQPLHNKPDENKEVRWFTREEALLAPNEKWMTERIYRKLDEKVKSLK